jgi:hypothetical protein
MKLIAPSKKERPTPNFKEPITQPGHSPSFVQHGYGLIIEVFFLKKLMLINREATTINIHLIESVSIAHIPINLDRIINIKVIKHNTLIICPHLIIFYTV